MDKFIVGQHVKIVDECALREMYVPLRLLNCDFKVTEISAEGNAIYGGVRVPPQACELFVPENTLEVFVIKNKDGRYAPAWPCGVDVNFNIEDTKDLLTLKLKDSENWSIKRWKITEEDV